MDVFIIRHAIAEVAPPGMVDSDRALTDRGRNRFAMVVDALRDAEVSFDRIYTSPWKRAASTAEMLASLGGDVVITDLLAMTPDDALLERLHSDPAARADYSAVACVGHEPWMSELAALLLFGKRSAADTVPFKKGGVAWLSGEPVRAGMYLKGFLPPKWARQINR